MRDSASRLRVVLVIGSADRGGAEHQLVRLAARLLARGLDVRVWFLARSGPLTEELDEAHVPWEVLRPGSLPSSTASPIVTALRMGSRLAHQQPDVVFAWLPGAIWMTLTLAALLTRAKRVAALRG